MMPLLRLLAAPFVSVWRFWTVPVRAEPLAAFRILLGVTVLGNLLTGFAWRLPAAVGEDPLIPGKTRDAWLARGGRVCLLRGPTGLPLLGEWLPPDAFGEGVRLRRPLHLPWLGTRAPSDVFGEGVDSWEQGWVSKDRAEAWREWGERPSSAYLLFGLYLLSAAMLAVGFLTRLSALAAVLLAGTFNTYLSEYINGGDFLMRNGLWFLLLSPAGAVWSVDAWLWGRKGPVMVAPWSIRLMQIQVCLMYFFVGVTKLADLHFVEGSWWPRGDWVDGNALYWVMNDVAIMRWSYAQVPIPYFVCQLMTWGTLAFEIGFPLFVLWKWTRIPLLLAGVMLHLGILLVMEIGWFSQVTLCWYVLFLSGDTVTAGARWLFGGPNPGPGAGTG